MTVRDVSASEVPAEPIEARGVLIALRRFGIIFGGLFAALFLVISLFLTLKIPIEFQWIKGKIETGSTADVGRNVTIEGPLKLIPSIPPRGSNRRG